MARQSSREKTSGTRKWDAGSSLGKRMFDEELALFERQVRSEIQERLHRTDVLVGRRNV